MKNGVSNLIKYCKEETGGTKPQSAFPTPTENSICAYDKNRKCNNNCVAWQKESGTEFTSSYWKCARGNFKIKNM